jgi:DNA polymerase-3 subunit delta'
LLLLGASGNGTLPLALAFANAIQCEGTLTEQGGCGQCRACRKTQEAAHPDVHFSYPTVGANAVSTDFLKQWRSAIHEHPYMDVQYWLQRLEADNKQGNITTAECNAIVKKLSLKTFEGKYKILVMWLPEYLGKEGNRLLKLIEEPPEKTIFLLVAENTDMILNTILSRCQLIKTDPLTDEEVAKGLQEEKGLLPEQAAHIAFLAGENYGTALQLAGGPEQDHAPLLLEWLRKCWRGNGVEMVQWTEQFAQAGREKQKQFLQYGLHFLREMLLLVTTGSLRLRLPASELAIAQNMSKVLNFEKITAIATLFNENIGHVERNANPKILFLDASIEINKILKQ